MTTDLKSLLAEIRELKAMVAQLGAVRVAPTVDMEIAACLAQGIDVATYFKEKGRRAIAADRKKRGKSCKLK